MTHKAGAPLRNSGLKMINTSLSDWIVSKNIVYEIFPHPLLPKRGIVSLPLLKGTEGDYLNLTEMEKFK
jgi:hypothetical protein